MTTGYGRLNVFAAAILALAIGCRAEMTPDMVQKTEAAGSWLDIGDGLCIASFWGFLPIVYDAGLLTMMSARGSLATQYRAKFHEDPPSFGESGESAYAIGWAMKGSAIAGLFLTAKTDYFVLAVIAFPILWLGGTFKHYEAQRLMLDDGVNRKNLILDPKETRREAPGKEIRLALPYSF